MIHQLAFKSQQFCSFNWLKKRAKFDPNGGKIAVFLKKITKIAQRHGFQWLGAPSPDSRLQYA